MTSQNQLHCVADIRFLVDDQYLTDEQFPVVLKVRFHGFADGNAGVLGAEPAGVRPEERYTDGEIMTQKSLFRLQSDLQCH